jgi:putative ABC transport system ATP-binding protein
VLADEPTGNLDSRNGRAALALIRQTCHENNAALLLVSHDREALAQFDHVHQFSQISETSPAGVCA